RLHPVGAVLDERVLQLDGAFLRRLQLDDEIGRLAVVRRHDWGRHRGGDTPLYRAVRQRDHRLHPDDLARWHRRGHHHVADGIAVLGGERLGLALAVAGNGDRRLVAVRPRRPRWTGPDFDLHVFDLAERIDQRVGDRHFRVLAEQEWLVEIAVAYPTGQ